MNAKQILDEILAMLYQVKESREDLQKIHDFMSENIIIVEEEEEDLVIPVQHRKAVAEIADNIQCGFICQVNKKTVEIVSIRRENSYEFGDYDEEEEEEETDDNNLNWEDIVTISPLESHESFRIMEKFVLSLNESRLKHLLASALQRHKPFANFNGIIHNSPERDQWFEFRKHAYEQHVAEILMAQSAWENL